MVSRIVAINSSHIKGPDGAIASIHSSAADIFAKALAVGTVRLLKFHRPQFTRANLERLEVCPSHTPLEQGFSFSCWFRGERIEVAQTHTVETHTVQTQVWCVIPTTD
ncbi:hypothetical protein AVEN_107826-1 [Araneus ventricosus]|uniref:Uncharacterized protein n=1 Tax=Araneus ventricosus TaxID=182803 RepID=A0A4Y2SXD2_ARAVE|nr:hypothetical protein AVEN_107826-1 [Araneus ventricosus]